MINNLLLLSGNDIPFLNGQVNIHQPTIKEIAYIGEETFFTGCQLLNFSKDMLDVEDNINLENISNFEVLMSIINDKNPSSMIQRTNISLLLTILFPEHEIHIMPQYIFLIKRNSEGELIEQGFVNKDNFEEFKKIISEMFCLQAASGDDEYNPGGELAKKIAEKLKERKKKLAELQKNEGEKKIAIFGRYVSILSVGEQKDMNQLMQYTVYQLFDEFQRYQLKLNFDYYLQAKMAGAKDLKEVDDWMKDLHP